METVDLAGAPNAVLEKLLANETLTGAYGTSYIERDGGAEAEFRCMRPPVFSHPKKSLLQNVLQSGLSSLRVPMSDNSKSNMAPPSTKKGSNWNFEQSMKHVGETLKVTKQQETCLVLSSQTNVGIEAAKTRGGKGSRGGGTSRKRPRPAQAGCLVPEVGNMVNKGRGGSCERAEKVEKKSRRRTSSQSTKKGERRNLGTVAAEDPYVKCGLFSDVNLGAKPSCILDIYGLKTRQVYPNRFMTELSLEDLLVGEIPSHKTVEVKHCERGESFLMQINHVLEQLPKWPSGCGIVPKTVFSMAPHIFEEGKLSRSTMSPQSSLKGRDDSGTHSTLGIYNQAGGCPLQYSSGPKAVDNENMPNFGPMIQDAAHVQTRLNINKGLSLDTLPLQSFEDCINSLKLSPSESLETLIAHATAEAGSGLAEPCTLASNSLYYRNGKMPPLAFSLPPAGTLKTGMFHEKESSNWKAVQEQWVQTVLKANMSEHGFQNEYNERYNKQSAAVRSRSNKRTKAEVEVRDDKKVEESIQPSPVSTQIPSYLGNHIRLDAQSPSEGWPTVTPQVNMIGQFSKAENSSDTGFLVSDAVRNCEGKVADTSPLCAEKSTHTRHQANQRAGCCENQTESTRFDVTDHRSLEKSEMLLSNRVSFSTTLEKGKGDQGKIYQVQGQLQGAFCGEPVKDITTQTAPLDRSCSWLKDHCEKCYSKLSNSMPDRPVSPRAVDASVILYHMANCPSVTEFVKARKTRRRVLQAYPCTPTQKAPKNMKTEHLTARATVSPGQGQNEQKESKNKSSGSFSFSFSSKAPTCERRKNLSEVGDSLQGPVKSSMATAYKGLASNGLRGTVDNLGSQSTIRSSKIGKESTDRSRENGTHIGRGTLPYRGFSNAYISSSNQNIMAKSPSCPSNQRSLMSDDPTNVVAVGGSRTGRGFHSKDDSRHGSQSYSSCTSLKASTQTLTSLADNRPKPKPETARGRLIRP